ncbi:MAG: YigZ family protein [Enterococcus sp.]
MLTSYYTLEKDGQVEIEIKKSRFICSLKRIESESEAKDYLQKLKKEHWKANHNCSALILGEQAQIQRSSDDGEPSGTAGIPMLEVLKKNELINVIAVVTRYFGGTKLGAGGLIRAYSHSVAEALNQLGIVKCVLQQAVTIQIAYPLLGKLQNFLELHNIYVEETLFAEHVGIVCKIDEADYDAFVSQVIDLLNNQVAFEKGSVSYSEIPI